MGAVSAASAAQQPLHTPNGTLPRRLSGEGQNDERNGVLRLVLGAICMAALIFAFYHASTAQQGAPSALAGILAPAAIMVSYLVWVLYSTRSRHRMPQMLPTLEGGVVSTEPSAASAVLTQEVTRSHQQRSNSASPEHIRAAAAARRSLALANRSTESLHRVERTAPPDRPAGATLPAVHQQRRLQQLSRSTLQLNNARQLAAAVSNLPSFQEATDRNNWLLASEKNLRGSDLFLARQNKK